MTDLQITAPGVAFAAAGLLFLQFLFWQWVETRKAKRFLPKPVPFRTRFALSLWGMVSPWMDNIHFLRLIYSKKSALVVRHHGQRAMRGIRLRHLAGPKGVSAVNFVLIHGTWANEDFNTRWHQLIAALQAEYPNATIYGLHWMAFNNSGVRLLTKTHAVRGLRRIFGRADSVDVRLVGFSHGGSLLTEIMRHASTPPHWRATVVGMPLLTMDPIGGPAPERYKGAHLLWYPRSESTRPTQLIEGWMAIPTFFILAYIFADEFSPTFRTLCFVLAGLFLFNRYLKVNFARQGLTNSSALLKTRHRNERRMRRIEYGADANYLGMHLVHLSRRLDLRKARKSCSFLHASADEVLMFNDGAFDTTLARSALNDAPMKRRGYSEAISRHMEAKLGTLAKFTWPGFAVSAFEFEWFGVWSLHRQLAKRAHETRRAQWYLAPKGLIYILAMGFAWIIYVLLNTTLELFGDARAASIGAATGAVGVVAFHPWIFRLQRLRGSLHGNFLAEETLQDAIEDRSSLRNGAYDSLGDGQTWSSVGDLSDSSKPVSMLQAVRTTLSLGRHRASLNDPAVVARIVEIVRRNGAST